MIVVHRQDAYASACIKFKQCEDRFIYSESNLPSHYPITWKVALTVDESSKLITSSANSLRINNTCIAITNIYVLSFAGHYIPHHLIHPNRKIVNSIFRLRTGHAVTRSRPALYHLTNIKSCPFYRCVIDETIDHIFSECPRFTTERIVLREKSNDWALRHPPLLF